jgi:hypothetical protein
MGETLTGTAPRPGRRTLGPVKDEKIEFRLTAADRARLEAEARQAGAESLGHYARMRLLGRDQGSQGQHGHQGQQGQQA